MERILPARCIVYAGSESLLITDKALGVIYQSWDGPSRVYGKLDI